MKAIERESVSNSETSVSFFVKERRGEMAGTVTGSKRRLDSTSELPLKKPKTLSVRTSIFDSCSK